MRRSVWILGAACVLSLAGCAHRGGGDLPTPKAPVQARYVVQSGDSWQRISELYFGGFSHNLHATKARTGILVMVSLLEHRVEILADTGINAKVPRDTWQKILNDMIGKIKSGDLTEGFCTAVRECGEVLAKDFPGTLENPNEISDRVILED